MLERKALVIGADPQIKAMLSNVLDRKLWTVQDASGNVAALQLVRETRFDLILTDQKTSSREDLDLLRMIRRIHPHTRFIILTQEKTSPDVVAAIRAGAFSFFSKPVCLESLSSIVEQATEGPCWDDGIEIVSATPDWIRLLARCDMKTADRLLQFFHEIIDLPGDERNAVGVAFREMLLNAIEHGAKFSREQFVEISYLRTRHAVACRIKDPGEGFKLDEMLHAAIANPPDDPLRHVAYRNERNIRPGGFGVLLARNIIDELLYNEQGNEVILVKYVDGERRNAAT